MTMDRAVECTHCKVVMTSWSAPKSPIRYYQCPFCARTHSSLYGEVFRRGAGARLVDAPARDAVPERIPMASAEDIRWARVKATAARWFARVEADEQRLASPRLRRAAGARELPVVDPSDVVEVQRGAAPRAPRAVAAAPRPASSVAPRPGRR
jgi:type IV secretory pathway VirJ component